LSVEVFGSPSSSDGLPGGHANFDRGHPGLSENLLEGVMVVEVFSAPLSPQVVQEKTPEDVKGLPEVREASFVINKEVRRILLAFVDGFPEEHEGPRDVDVSRRLPLLPDFSERAPGALRLGALKKAVDGGLDLIGVANLAKGVNSHELEPSANREALVECQPDEGPDLLWIGVVPDSGDHLVHG